MEHAGLLLKLQKYVNALDPVLGIDPSLRAYGWANANFPCTETSTSCNTEERQIRCPIAAAKGQDQDQHPRGCQRYGEEKKGC